MDKAALKTLSDTLNRIWGIPEPRVYYPNKHFEKPEPVEQTMFSVFILDAGPKRINVIKEIRSILGLTLKESKDFVDNIDKSLVQEDLEKWDADALAETLSNVGATVEVS